MTSDQAQPNAIPSSQKLSDSGRIAFIAIAGFQSWIFLGGALLGIALTVGAVPSDPVGDGATKASPSSWTEIRMVLALLAAGLPAAVGLVAMLTESFPARTPIIALSALAMVGVTALSIVFLVNDWSLA